MFIVRLQTLDEQRVATAEKRCWRILWELAKIIPRSAEPACGNASRTGSYFTGGTSGSPCRSGDELQQSAFLMGNLDGAGRMGKLAPTTNCLHCQLAGASFFSVVLLPPGEEGWRPPPVRWSLFALLQASGDALRRSALRITGGVSRPEEQERLTGAPSALSMAVRSGEQRPRLAGGQSSCPVGRLDGFQFQSLRRFLTG